LLPDQLITELSREFGLLAAQKQVVEDAFWEAVWEIESSLKPDWTKVTSYYTVTDIGDVGEVDVSTAGDIIDISSVVNGSSRLGKVSLDRIRNLPTFLQTASLYSFDPNQKKVFINKSTTPLPPQVRVTLKVKTEKVPSTTDIPWLSDAYSIVRQLMSLRLAEYVKDQEKVAQFLSTETARMLGRSR